MALEGSTREDWEPLREFATEEQIRAVEALLLHGNVADAASSLKLPAMLVRNRLKDLRRKGARRGWSPEHDNTKLTPEGFHLRGTSTLYDAQGRPRMQWVKTAKDQETRLQALIDAAPALLEPLKGKSTLSSTPAWTGTFASDLLTVYPMGDPHIGLYTWAAETGDSFDLEIAEQHLCEATSKLVSLAPASEEACIFNLGDFFHSDNSMNRTMRSGNALDVDTRWPKVLGVGIRAMRCCIDLALRKHQRVRVVNEIGNHDDHSAIFLSLCLANFYENNPRVTIDVSPDHFHWVRFGRCLIGTTHGDKVKAAQLPGIMAVDRVKDWGETRHRRWYVGHVHNERVTEFPGVTVETFRTLAAKDSWTHNNGYRSDRDMRADVWHRERGLVLRHIVGIEQLSSSFRA